MKRPIATITKSETSGASFMTTLKKLMTLLVFISFTFSLFGCATIYHRGDGVIIAEKKIKDKDYKPHHAAETGAVIGGSVGGAGGAVTGGLIGFLAGGFLSNSIPVAIVSALGGGAIGALIVGAAGGALGGGIGYAVDVTTPGAGVYEFIVKSDNEPKPLTITQYTTPMPLQTAVHILEKDNLIFIKQK